MNGTRGERTTLFRHTGASVPEYGAALPHKLDALPRSPVGDLLSDFGNGSVWSSPKATHRRGGKEETGERVSTAAETDSEISSMHPVHLHSRSVRRIRSSKLPPPRSNRSKVIIAPGICGVSPTGMLSTASPAPIPLVGGMGVCYSEATLRDDLVYPWREIDVGFSEDTTGFYLTLLCGAWTAFTGGVPCVAEGRGVNSPSRASLFLSLASIPQYLRCPSLLTWTKTVRRPRSQAGSHVTRVKRDRGGTQGDFPPPEPFRA